MITASQDPYAVSWLAFKYHKQGFIPVFDLDGVLFDATHRQATLPDGSLNLAKYRELATLENVAKDKPLPLIGAVHALNGANVPYMVCTARLLCEGTYKLLTDHGIFPAAIHGRTNEDGRKDHELKAAALAGIKALLIDDNLANLQAIEKIGGLGIHVPFHGH